jgi:hypothetical protein
MDGQAGSGFAGTWNGRLELRSDRWHLDLCEHSRVRIKQLPLSPEAYDDWEGNQRPPRVGDMGIVISIYQRPGSPEGYCQMVECVECVEPGGAPLWLGDFSAEELEPVCS